MELYTYFRSSASYRVRIALALKGIDYTPHFVSLPKDEHAAADYRRVNPQGLVPALVDGDAALTQSLAILEYLDETYPEPPLLPADTMGRAYVRALSQIVACEIHPLNNLRVLRYLETRWRFDQDARNAWYRHWVAEGLGAVEAQLRAERRYGRFCLGDAPGMADVCLVPQIFNARRFDCPLDGYPTVTGIFDACMALDAFDKTQPKLQPDAF